MKYLPIANIFYYLEICIRICATLIPNKTNELHTAVVLTMISLAIFVAFYCDQLGHLIMATLYLIFAIFFQLHVIYEKELTGIILSTGIFYTIGFIICTTAFAILLVYIKEL